MPGNIPILNLTVANWVLTGTAILLSVGRFAIRLKVQRRLYGDDAAHLVAILALIAFSISYQMGFPTFIHVVEVSSGTIPRPPDFDRIVTRYRQYQNAVSFTEWIALWAVKITFMLFYRLLFNVSKVFRIAWWIILVLTVALFWVPIAGVLTLCGPTRDFFNNDACFSNLKGQRIILEYSCAAQVFTDLIIMALPLSMLRYIRRSTDQKLGLGLIFSIAIVTVALDIVRTVESISGGAFGYISLYCILETTFTVIISSLPVYRSLVSYIQKKYSSAATRGRLIYTEKRTPAGGDSDPVVSHGSRIFPKPMAMWHTGQDSTTARGVHEGYGKMSSQEVILQPETQVPL